MMGLRLKKLTKAALIVEHQCAVVDFPNSWGHQDFNGLSYRFGWDKQIDVNNKLDRYSFIRDFQIRYIDGIRLKKPQASRICRHCNC